MYFSTSFIFYVSWHTKSVPKYKEIGSLKHTHNPFLNLYLSLLSPLITWNFFHSSAQFPTPPISVGETLGSDEKGTLRRELLPSITKTERKNWE